MLQLRAGLEEAGGLLPGFVRVCDCVVQAEQQGLGGGGSKARFNGMIMEKINGERIHVMWGQETLVMGSKSVRRVLGSEAVGITVCRALHCGQGSTSGPNGLHASLDLWCIGAEGQSLSRMCCMIQHASLHPLSRRPSALIHCVRVAVHQPAAPCKYQQASRASHVWVAVRCAGWELHKRVDTPEFCNIHYIREAL